MKRIAIITAAALGLGLGLSSCATESTTPVEPGKYVPATAGSYFIHGNRAFDTDAGGATDTLDVLSDSTVVTGTKTVEGRSAVESVIYVGGFPIDTSYDAQQGSVVSTLLPLEFDVLGAPVDLGKKWVNLYDENSSSWTALRDSIPTFTIDAGPSGSYTGSAGLDFTGKKLGTETVTINGVSVATQKVEITLNITLYLMFGPQAVPVPIQLVRTYWFANNIGWVKMMQPAKVVNIMGIPPLPIDGAESTLLRYNIVK